MIGLGVGAEHLAAYARHPACEPAVICDLSADKLKEIERQYPGVAETTSEDNVLSDPAIDIVSIASYDAAHAAQAIAALKAGKHVFVEKPLCMTIAEAEQIRQLLHGRPDLQLSSNLILRRSPRFTLIKGMIDAGEFGTLFHVEGEYNYGRLHKLTEGWRGRDPKYSVILGGAVHMIDLLLWLTEQNIVEVSAFGNRIASAGSAAKCNDMVAALLRFEGGMTGTITANFGCVMPHGHGLSLFGTKATFINGSPDGQLHVSRDPSATPRRISAEPSAPSKGELIAGFINSIASGVEPIVSVDDVFRTMSVCLAIDKAVADGRPVEVEYV